MEQTAKNQNGWNEWSRHVLKELERLNTNYESIQDNLRELNDKMTTYNTEAAHIKEDIVLLENWKTKVDDVMSPTQMDALVKQVDSLKTFKTQAITVFVIVNLLWGVGVTIANFFFK